MKIGDDDQDFKHVGQSILTRSKTIKYSKQKNSAFAKPLINK